MLPLVCLHLYCQLPQIRWPMPRQVGSFTVSDLFKRRMQVNLPPFYEDSALSKLGRALLSPLRGLFWRGLEGKIRKSMGLGKDVLDPPVPLMQVRGV